MAAHHEYGTVVRVDNRTLPPATHELVLNTEPLHILQFCRTMTLAQGRILYEVLDMNERWHPRSLGYFVPSQLVAEARKISCRDRKEDWKELHPVKLRRYEEAWDAVVKAWPGIPIFGARRVVEHLMVTGFGCGKFDVEEAVVRYAMRNWTSYSVRLEASGVSKRDTLSYRKMEAQVEEQVAARLREVLEKWMRPDLALSQIESFFERHGLLQAAAQSRPRWFT